VTKGILDVLDRVRTPARPGPGSVSAANLRALDTVIARRIDGLLAGDYRSSFAGVGTEFHQVRPYQPGDDVRRIDWNVTARTGVTHVRVELAEHQLVTWLVVDESASMAFGTADRRKIDVVEGVAIAVGIVATRRANRLGVVAFGGDDPRFRRPTQGRAGLLNTLRIMRDIPAGKGDLNQALRLVDALAVQRALVVVVSDFRGPIDWQRGLLRIASRHQALAIEVRDPREQELTDIGELRLRDPETGRQLLVNTRDPVVRELFATAAVDERRQVLSALSAVGVPHIVLSTEGDWLRPLAQFLADRSRR
jgi:uncharacterized protein (DUF58 family)